jgi:glycosyltransferase involved in cell wall biosynthesis
MKIAFVTNLCPHYRVGTFETLARYHDVDFLFFSEGRESYWDTRHGLSMGDFRGEYLRGLYLIPGVRIVPALAARLLSGDYAAVIKCINGRFALPLTYLISRLRRIPFVLWTGIWHHPDIFFHHLTYPLTRYLYGHADAIVVYGEHVRRYLVSLGVCQERIFEAWHALDNSRYNQSVSKSELDELRQAHGLADRRVVLFVGRLEPEKGLSSLIQALGKVSREDTVLLFVGDGHDRTALEWECAKYKVPAVFAGYVPTEKLYRYYALSELFVLPSITTPTFKEPWGLVVNEAMNQGVPVIASEAVGAAAGGLVQNGVNGFIVPEGDAEALAQAIDRLLNDEPLRAQMGRASLRTIGPWDNERMVQGFRSALRYACSQRGISYEEGRR